MVGFITKKKPPLSRFPTSLDAMFKKLGQGLPVAFLRVLAYHESRMKADAQSGSHRGLFQVSPTVLKEYNQAKGTKFTKSDLFEMDTNTTIAAWYLNRIIRAYNASGYRALKGPNWLSREWVKLLVAGWNSGWSKAGGVQKVVKWLKDHGDKIDHDQVFRKSKLAKATRHLSNKKKWAWQRKVAHDFIKERVWTPSGVFADPTGRGSTWLLLLAALYLWSRR